MPSINPAMSSTIQSYAPQQMPLISKEDKTSDRTTPSSSSAGNTTVTLSSVAQALPADYSSLASIQTVKQGDSVENRGIDRNENTVADLTYSSNLQLRSSYDQGNVMKSDISSR